MLSSMQDYNNDCPCNGCTERYRCCHDSCEKYKTWKKKRYEKWDKINFARMKEGLVSSYIAKEQKKLKHPDRGIGSAARLAIYREKKQRYQAKK